MLALSSAVGTEELRLPPIPAAHVAMRVSPQVDWISAIVGPIQTINHGIPNTTFDYNNLEYKSELLKRM